MSILPDRILNKIADPKERKKLGRAGITACEAWRRETTKLERKIHDEFASWCRRNEITFWHSNPTRKSSIGVGLPDFLCVRGGRCIGIEFKVYPNTLSPEQLLKISELREHGTGVCVCTEGPDNSAYAEATSIVAEYFGLDAQ